jgi:hypothetical protein
MSNSELENTRNELNKDTTKYLRSMSAPQEELKKVPLKATSFLFNKKSQKLILKPFKHRYSDTGPTRHYTPATQE